MKDGIAMLSADSNTDCPQRYLQTIPLRWKEFFEGPRIDNDFLQDREQPKLGKPNVDPPVRERGA
jgi:hypothetical protein